LKLSQTLLKEIYLTVLSRTMSLWWFGTLNLKLLMDSVDATLLGRSLGEADLDQIYLPRLAWLSEEERKTVSTMHDSLWTLPIAAQRLVILSWLLGLSAEHIGEHLLMRKENVARELATAQELMLTRWQPGASVLTKLQSLVFMPGLDITQETDLRFSVVEKYNAIRFRRYQWIIIGGIFAVLSNVIVASVLAFAVVTQPPTSLRSSRTQVASLDAILLKRETEVAAAKRSLLSSFKENQKIAAYDVTRSLTTLGFGTALDALNAEQKNEVQIDRIVKLLERAKTALGPFIDGPLFAVHAILSSGT
jgi:hypothetical protein